MGKDARTLPKKEELFNVNYIREPEEKSRFAESTKTTPVP
jgi:hypothetical protein